MAEDEQEKEGAKTAKNLGQLTKTSGRSSAAVIFSSLTLVELLWIFLLDPEEEHYQRDLAHMTGAKDFRSSANWPSSREPELFKSPRRAIWFSILSRRAIRRSGI